MKQNTHISIPASSPLVDLMRAAEQLGCRVILRRGGGYALQPRWRTPSPAATAGKPLRAGNESSPPFNTHGEF